MAERRNAVENMALDSAVRPLRRVFVTGATGMVGAWVVRELLRRQATVVVLVRDPEPHSELYRSGDIAQTYIVSGQLEDYATLDRAISEYEIDTVLHLGAQTIVGHAKRAPLHTFEANIRGTWNLLEACRVHRDLVQSIVIASSDKAYGDQPVLPYTEHSPLQGRYPYDVSKSCVDLISQSYWATYQLPLAIARCGNIFGGGDLNWSRIVPGTVRSLHQRQAPIIRSNGLYQRDYIYVKDVVDSYLDLAEQIERPGVTGEAFNFSLEQPLAVTAIVERIAALMDVNDLPPVIQNQASGEIIDQYLNSTKARQTLGWQPRYGLDEGLSETIAWYRSFLGDHG